MCIEHWFVCVGAHTHTHTQGVRSLCPVHAPVCGEATQQFSSPNCGAGQGPVHLCVQTQTQAPTRTHPHSHTHTESIFSVLPTRQCMGRGIQLDHTTILFPQPRRWSGPGHAHTLEYKRKHAHAHAHTRTSTHTHVHIRTRARTRTHTHRESIVSLLTTRQCVGRGLQRDHATVFLPQSRRRTGPGLVLTLAYKQTHTQTDKQTNTHPHARTHTPTGSPSSLSSPRASVWGGAYNATTQQFSSPNRGAGQGPVVYTTIGVRSSQQQQPVCVRVCVPACLRACAPARVRVCVCACACACAYVCVWVYVNVLVCVCVCVCVRACVCTRVYWWVDSRGSFCCRCSVAYILSPPPIRLPCTNPPTHPHARVNTNAHAGKRPSYSNASHCSPRVQRRITCKT